MSGFKTCKTCKLWAPYSTKYPNDGCARADARAGGICGSDKLTESYGQGRGADMLVYPYSEGGEFWTGPEFGCVHHVDKKVKT